MVGQRSVLSPGIQAWILDTQDARRVQRLLRRGRGVVG
jgi:hypothetical protein